MKAWHTSILLLCLIVIGCSSNSPAPAIEKSVPISSGQSATSPSISDNPVSSSPTATITSASVPSVQPTTAPNNSVSAADWELQLQSLWDKLDKGASKPTLSWKLSYSVAFPNDWSPTSNTIWTRYAYAQGMDLDLRDAVRIASPWAKLELRGNSATVNIASLSTKLDAVTVQGVSPIDATTRAILAKEKSVTDYALQLTSLPLKTDAQATEMRTFYKTWLKYNGALVDLIKSKHIAFLNWVNE